MRQATGLVNVSTPVQACRFCGLVSRLATIRGPYGIGRQPRRGDLGASVLVRAGCGEGECGGSRLVGSEKSPIVTLSAVRGAGRADRERTDEDCVHRTRGWGPSRLQESAVLAGYRSPCGWGALLWRSRSYPSCRGQGASRGRWLALCSHGNAVSQVTVDSGNGPQPAKVEPVRLKVVCSQVDRA